MEALEFVVHTGAKSSTVLALSDKWIIPRNALVDVLFALNVFGQETVLSWIPEFLLHKFFYRDLEDLAAQSRRLFTETPMVNSEVFHETWSIGHSGSVETFQALLKWRSLQSSRRGRIEGRCRRRICC